MRRVVGVDGCRAGWLALTIDDDRSIRHTVHADAASLFSGYERDALIAIDIPIGLPESGSRACDLQARRRLGRRGSTVFPAPIRAVLCARDYGEANSTSRAVDGRGLSKQTWNICQKIAEVDAAVRADESLARRTVEVHPESSFAAWAGGPLTTRKNEQAGVRERRTIVEGWLETGVFDLVRAGYLKKNVADDDINDAFAALWTGRRVVAGESIEFGDGASDAMRPHHEDLRVTPLAHPGPLQDVVR